MEQVYVLIATTSSIIDPPDFGFSDINYVYKDKEEAVKTIIDFGYKPVDGQADLFERLSDGGKFRHRYKIVAKNIW